MNQYSKPPYKLPMHIGHMIMSNLLYIETLVYIKVTMETTLAMLFQNV